jgi:ubiquinone biosynthesis protein UbiJ
MPATPAWLAAVEALLNRGIESSTQAEALARRLEATTLRVDIRGMTSIRAGITAGKIMLAGAGAPKSEVADATIAGSPPALLTLMLRRRSARHPPADSARPTVQGDAEIASLYQQLFAAARPDVEEELSRLMGDTAARRVAQFAQRTAAWTRSIRNTAGANIAEYLQEESRDLVGKYELEEFLQGVDAARETADRLEARISRLEHRIKGSP